MARRPTKPRWLTLPIVAAIHDDLLAEHGGMPGLRDAGLLESALGRPVNRWVYQGNADLCECTAAYGFGIAPNHAFNDGNKRTAFQAMFVFLGLNGLDLDAPEPEAVHLMVAVAGGKFPEAGLVAWLRDHTRKLPRPRKSRRR